jgi:hypothetical protein
MRFLTSAILALGLLAAAPTTPAAHAQSTSMTQADVSRLQDAVYDLSNEVSRVRRSDPQLADRLQGDVDDLRDEVIYLKVRLRKEGSVSRSEYTEMRDRIDDLRSQARGTSDSVSREVPGSGARRESPTETPGESGVATVSRTPPASSGRANGGATETTRRSEGVIPVGQEIDVRLQDPLNSGRNVVEDRFLATTLVDLQVGDRVVIPAGSEVRGVVSSVTSAGRVNRKGSITVSFDEITMNGRSYPMRGTVTQALESEGVKGEVGRIGTGAGVGAIIGGILGGFKGALAGILIGGGGVVAATEGKEVDLPPGTVLRVRLDAPPNVR